MSSRLWKKAIPDPATPQRVPQQPSSAAERTSGWVRLPPELVDEILGYLLDDLPTLNACSLTCKIMLGSARPLIRTWVFLVSTWDHRSNARFTKSLLKRSKGSSDPFEKPVIPADRLGLLQSTRRLAIRKGRLPLTPQSLKPYIPHIRSISKLQTLIIGGLDVSLLAPVFDKYFWRFNRSLRGLGFKKPFDFEHQLVRFTNQFPMLEDLKIHSSHIVYSHPGTQPPKSPPFRRFPNSTKPWNPCDDLSRLSGGLNTISLVVKGCGKPGAAISSCQPTLRSLLHTWTGDLGKHPSIPSK